jgi:hypothetical protein
MEEAIAFLSRIQMFGIPFLSYIEKHTPPTNDLVFSSLMRGNLYQLFKVDENDLSSVNIVEATLKETQQIIQNMQFIQGSTNAFI